ncbi:MAG: YHS domain-containing (seleno)protein [Pseudomonadota bacterium]
MTTRASKVSWALFLGVFLGVMTVGAAFVQSAIADSGRLGLKGHDPVGYFTEGRPVQGKSEFEAVWHGTHWRFSSAANRDLFVADPDRYAPQYGGYCAFGVAMGMKSEVDPQAWTIVNGKLYVKLNMQTRDTWRQDQVANIQKAAKNWATLERAN